MYLKYPTNNLTYIYSQTSPYVGVLDAWIEGKVEEYKDSITSTMPCAFAFQNFSNVFLPQCSIINDRAFAYCTTLEEVKVLNCNTIEKYGFVYCSNFVSLYLLSSEICTLVNKNAFYGTPMSSSSYLGYYGSIYVPSALVETYKAAENWSYYADRITAYVP